MKYEFPTQVEQTSEPVKFVDEAALP